MESEAQVPLLRIFDAAILAITFDCVIASLLTLPCSHLLVSIHSLSHCP
jgi:hypothetical protein